MSEAQTITDRMESKRRSKPQQRCGGESYVSENEKKKQRTFKLRNVNFDHHETPSNVLIIPAHGRVSNVAVIACREWWLEPCHPHYVRQGLWCE